MLHLCGMQHIHCHSLGLAAASGCAGGHGLLRSLCVYFNPGGRSEGSRTTRQDGIGGVRSHLVPWTRGTERTNPRRVIVCHCCCSVVQPDHGGWGNFIQAKVASNAEANPIPCRVSSPVLALLTASEQNMKGGWRCRKGIPHWCCQHQAREVEVCQF